MIRPADDLVRHLDGLPRKERRTAVMKLVVSRELMVEHAAWILNLSVRQIQRLKKRFNSGLDDWDRHGNSGRTPANATSDELRQREFARLIWPTLIV